VPHLAFALGELLLLALALALAVLVHGHPAPLPGDVDLARGLQHLLLPHHVLTALLDAVSAVNWPTPSAITVAAVLVVLLVRHRRLDALLALTISVVADASSYLTNQLVRRPRPADHGLAILQHITRYLSFPSGHVIHAVAFFGFLLFLTYQTRHPARWLWLVRLLLAALIVLMGPSRVLEGEHWPSDVLEGLLIGAFWLVLGLHAYNAARRRWPHLLGHDEPHGPSR
jgi:undecaprenyl-diphosphatase